MALSKPDVPNAVQDIHVPVLSQHYLVCSTEDCEKNCQFYCNPCHKPMCEQCRDAHQNSANTKSHEVVSFRQRKRQLPMEKCKDHPTKDIDMICEDCQVPLCSKCAIQDHRGHMFNDLETIYSERFTLWLDLIYKIHQYFLPTSQDMQKNMKEDFKEMKAYMDEIRTSMEAEAESLKRLVNEVLSDKIEQVNKMEESLIKELQTQNKTYEEYNIYLEDLVRNFHGEMSYNKVKTNPVIFSPLERLKIKPIPDTTKPVYPVFTAGQHSKDDVDNLFGKITAPNTKSEQKNTILGDCIITVEIHIKTDKARQKEI